MQKRSGVYQGRYRMKKSLGAGTFFPATPVVLVGTYDHEGKPNLMTAAWAGICCSKPPCMNVSLRKACYSYSGIQQRKAFTLGVAAASQVEKADFMGIASGRDTDKFEYAGFTAVKSDTVDAPYADQIPFVVECRLVQSIELGLHTLFVGEIMDVKADEYVIAEDGRPDLSILSPFSYDTMRKQYHVVGQPIGKAFSIGHP